MKPKDWLTDDQVEHEISRLKESPYVRLARAEQRALYRRRQYMYQLRNLEKRGKMLEAEGKDESWFDTQEERPQEFPYDGD